MEGELQSSHEENRRFRSEHTTLLMQLDNLKDVLQQKLGELESQAVELSAAVAQRQHLLEQVEQLQSELASARTQLASERRRAEEEQKKGEMQEPPGAWANPNPWKLGGSLRTTQKVINIDVCSAPFRMHPRCQVHPPGVWTHAWGMDNWIRPGRRCSWPELSRNEPHGW